MGNAQEISDSEREKLREQLTAIERLEDAATIDYLERLGVAPSWHCLEVGAGGGSIARWLSDRVGGGGRVVATDIQLSFLRVPEAPQVEIRRHDITSDELEAGAFDLVHARNLLTHIPGRVTALKKLAAAVKPGGWLLVEEPDVRTDYADPGSPIELQELYKSVVQIIYQYARDHGVDPNFGARIFGLLRMLGLECVKAEGRTRMFRGDPETRTPHQLAFEGLKDPLVTDGLVSERQYEAFMALYDNPAFAWRDGLRTSTWGRQPTRV